MNDRHSFGGDWPQFYPLYKVLCLEFAFYDSVFLIFHDGCLYIQSYILRILPKCDLGMAWCLLVESNSRVMITSQLLYHLIKEAF